MPNVQSPDAIWSAYIETTRPSPVTYVSYAEVPCGPNNQACIMSYYERSYNGKTMRYTVDICGEQTYQGFPLYIGLHGGGGTTEENNNAGWITMARNWYGQELRRRSGHKDVNKRLPEFMYIAIRGVENTWDTHFRPESYVLLQQLIRDLLRPKPVESESIDTIAPTFIDGNSVYLLGFSAGGDGVYHLGSGLADLFAAVNMSSGHPQEVQVTNFANLPICLQAGENDNPPHIIPLRNAETARFGLELDKSSDETGPYRYQTLCLIHKDKGHSGWSAQQDFGDCDSLVVAASSLRKWWLLNEERLGNIPNREGVEYEKCNTSSISFVSEYGRNPYPAYIAWDTACRPPHSTMEGNSALEIEDKRFFYWLMLPPVTIQRRRTGIFRVSCTKYRDTLRTNEIAVLNAPHKFTILLNDDMLDLKQPITFRWAFEPYARSIQVTAIEDSDIQRFTMHARGDPAFIFSAALTCDPDRQTVRNGLV